MFNETLVPLVNGTLTQVPVEDLLAVLLFFFFCIGVLTSVWIYVFNPCSCKCLCLRWCMLKMCLCCACRMCSKKHTTYLSQTTLELHNDI